MLTADLKRQEFTANAASILPRPPPGQATGFGFTAPEVQRNQRLTATVIEGDQGMVESIAGTATARNEEDAKYQKSRRAKIAAYGIASVTGSIISQEIFDDISEYVDNQIGKVRDDLMANRAEQARVKTEIAATDTEIAEAKTEETVADSEVHVAQVHAMRAADQLSMVKLEETELGEKLDSAQSVDEAIALLEQRRKLQEERARAERNCDKANETLDERIQNRDERTRIVAERMERRRELEDNLKRLESDETGLQARYDQLNSFREYMRSDAMQEKLENGTLTLEDLQAGGAPQDVLDMAKEKLEAGGTLTREDLRDKMKDGYRQIAAETRSVMGTSYASNYGLDGTRLAEAPPMAEQFLTAAAERIERWWNSSPAPDQPQTQIATAPVASGPSGVA